MRDLLGVPVIESPHLRKDQAYVMGAGGLATGSLMVGTRELTHAECMGNWVRWAMRRDLTAAFPWLRGVEVGREPAKDPADVVGIVATMRATFVAGGGS